MIQAVPTLAATAAPDAKAAADQKKLKSAAQAFEAVFLRQVIGSMRSASLGDGMFDNEGTETFQSEADGKMADGMAQKGVLGIADMLIKQLGPKTASGLAAAATTAGATASADRASALATPGGGGA
ncbi:MAG TPA: rod-binding protein [Sphingomonas sp.]